MNLFGAGATGQAIIFKIAMSYGAVVLDYQVFRNLSLILVSSIELSCLGISPISQFPSEDKNKLFWRVVTGQACFFLFNLCLKMIPLTFLAIIF